MNEKVPIVLRKKTVTMIRIRERENYHYNRERIMVWIEAITE